MFAWWRSIGSARVSAAWLADQHRTSDQQGIDQSAVQWPVNKIANENAWRNRYFYSVDRERERKRA